MFVSAFGIVLEIKYMKSIITCYFQIKMRLVVVVARDLGIGVGEEEWGVTADGYGILIWGKG